MKKILVVMVLFAFIFAGCGAKPAQRSGTNEMAASRLRAEQYGRSGDKNSDAQMYFMGTFNLL